MSVPVIAMWIVWIILVVVLAALYIYRTSLTKDEEDQIFLDDSFSKEKDEQTVIAAKLAKVEPLIAVSRWVVIVATGIIILYYAWDMWQQFR